MERKLTEEGFCVLLPFWFGMNNKELYRDSQWKNIFARTHYAKIVISQEILVINKDGFIGEDTMRDIEYAKKRGKIIRYLEEG